MWMIRLTVTNERGVVLAKSNISGPYEDKLDADYQAKQLRLANSGITTPEIIKHNYEVVEFVRCPRCDGSPDVRHTCSD